MQVIVEVVGWQEGFQKVACTELLRTNAGLGLAEAKRATDGILNGVKAVVPMPSQAAASLLSAELKSIGAYAHVTLLPQEM